jgi:hypothetical protein
MLGQHWTETTYVDEAIMTSIRNITNAHWSEMYRDVILDLSTAKTNTEATAISPSFTQATKIQDLLKSKF